MTETILLSSQHKKPFHHRKGSDDLDVFEATGYFSGATENFSGTCRNSSEANNFSKITQKYNTRPIRRISLDMPNNRGNSTPLQSMLIENPTMITKEKKFKQPSSPGGKLAHFLNSLFNQTSLKKSKKKSTKDEDESPSGWKRKRRSSISHFRSGTAAATATAAATPTAIVSRDDRSSFSTSTSSACFRTPPPYHIAHTHTKTSSYLKPPQTQIAKIPITENLNKIENFIIKSDFHDKTMSFRNGYVEKVKIFNEKQEEHHTYKHVLREDIKEFKKFTNDDGADSDSSSDLFELANCDLGRCSSGLPVYERTHSIKRGAPIMT